MKFINLLKKEISELVNVHMIATLGIMLLIFMIMGNLMTSAIDDVVEDVSHPIINISDCDDTDLTHQLIEALKSSKAEVNEFTVSGEDYAQMLKSNDIKNLIVIPDGFTDDITNDKRPQLITVSRMTSAASLANISSGNTGASSLISNCLKKIIADKTGINNDELERINEPIELVENTVVDNKYAPISTSNITAKVSMQNMALPIALLFLVMLTSQSLISSISGEKIDKTLETLLSAPISRMSIISAKMLAAAIVALINAAVMMIGFTQFMKGATDNLDTEVTSAVQGMMSTGDAFDRLGLTLGVSDYLLIGLQFFITIMICLSISIILGSLADDPKTSQTVLLPIMLLVMVPYAISMIADVNSLPTVAKLIVYAIPFTHTFTSMSNLMFGNDTLFIYGLIYQIIFFAVCMFFALKLFKSDKILTMSLNFGQRSKFKKKTSASEE